MIYTISVCPECESVVAPDSRYCWNPTHRRPAVSVEVVPRSVADELAADLAVFCPDSIHLAKYREATSA